MSNKTALDPELFNKGPNDGDTASRYGTLRIYKDPLDQDIGARRAKCTMCSNTSVTDKNLPFFELKEKADMDRYYCGCHGFE